MLNLLTQRHEIGRGYIVAALVLSAGAAAAPLIWNNPLAPLIIPAGLCAGTIAAFLLQRPLTALYMALFLHLLPPGFRVEVIFDIIVHSATALALASWLIDTASRRRPFLWNGVCILLALYIAWGCITLLWAPDLVEGRRKLVAYVIGFILIFLISNQVRSPSAIDGLMRVLRMIGWIMVIGGFQTMLFSNYQFGTRLTAWSENENSFGLILIMTLPGVIWPVIRSNGTMRILHMALSVVFTLSTLLLVALSGSRGSSISLAIALMGFCFWRPVRPWGIIGVVIVAGTLAAAPFLVDGLTKRFEEGEGGELGGREVLWEASVLLIQDNPWTGVGIGNGPFELHWYIQRVTSDPYKNLRLDYPSHNPLLEAGVDTGVIGIFIYIGMHVAALWQFFRSRRHLYMREGALAVYFALVLSVAAGFSASWIKSGGLEAHPLLFVLLALLTIPSQLHNPDRLVTK